LSHPLRTVPGMDTCEYCDSPITAFSAVAISALGHERTGHCETCGHVVSHVVRGHRIPTTLAG